MNRLIFLHFITNDEFTNHLLARENRIFTDDKVFFKHYGRWVSLYFTQPCVSAVRDKVGISRNTELSAVYKDIVHCSEPLARIGETVPCEQSRDTSPSDDTVVLTQSAESVNPFAVVKSVGGKLLDEFVLRPHCR